MASEVFLGLNPGSALTSCGTVGKLLNLLICKMGWHYRFPVNEDKWESIPEFESQHDHCVPWAKVFMRCMAQFLRLSSGVIVVPILCQKHELQIISYHTAVVISQISMFIIMSKCWHVLNLLLDLTVFTVTLYLL